jgi:hypothetical protein
MSLDYDIVFSSSTNDIWTISKSDKKVSRLMIENSDSNKYQTGILEIFNPEHTPQVGAVINVNINDINEFSGYVSRRKQSSKGTNLYNLQLIGKTYNLWRENIDSTAKHTYMDDYTSNIVYDCISTQTNIGYSNIPRDEGVYISGVFEFENESPGDLVYKMSEFDHYNFYIDSSNSLHYYNIDTTQGITVNESDVISYTPFQESDDYIYNDVVVVGKGVSYRYTSQSSINTYGRHRHKINEPRITTEKDASSMAVKFVDEYKDPELYGSITIDGDTSINIGEKFTLSLSNLGISETPKIRNYSHTIDDKGFRTKIQFGRSQYDPTTDISLMKNILNNSNYGIFEGLSEAANAQAAADGKIDSFYQDSEPATASQGDIWFDTDDDYKVYMYSAGSGWVQAWDQEIVRALASANTAQATADGKITTYYQASAPSSPDVGDLWVETDNDNYIRRYNGSSWENVGDWYTYWSNQYDDGNMPEDNADVTADNSQFHNWLSDSPKDAHHPSYLVNGQINNNITADSSGNMVYLDSDLNLHCDCLIITQFSMMVKDVVTAQATVNSSIEQEYIISYENCTLDTEGHTTQPQLILFVPSGGGWQWDFTAIDANDFIDLYSEHVVTLETDT